MNSKEYLAERTRIDAIYDRKDTINKRIVAGGNIASAVAMLTAAFYLFSAPQVNRTEIGKRVYNLEHVAQGLDKIREDTLVSETVDIQELLKYSRSISQTLRQEAEELKRTPEYSTIVDRSKRNGKIGLLLELGGAFGFGASFFFRDRFKKKNEEARREEHFQIIRIQS